MELDHRAAAMSNGWRAFGGVTRTDDNGSNTCVDKRCLDESVEVSGKHHTNVAAGAKLRDGTVSCGRCFESLLPLRLGRLEVHF
jgi:hypothetical protein